MSARSLIESLRGVIGVLVTPYTDGTVRVNEDLCGQLAQSLDQAGVHAITALGNSAEVHQLDIEERTAVLSSVATGRQSVPLIAGLAGSASDVLRTGSIAAKFGYNAVMLHEPADPFGDSAGLAAYYHWLCDRLPLPVILYLRSGHLAHADLTHLVNNPAVIAVKYAHPNLHALAQLLAGTANLPCVWVNGLAESAVPAFVGLGINGFTSGIVNARPDAGLAVHHAAHHGDLARLRELQSFISPVENLRNQNASRYNVAVLKEMLHTLGTNAGKVRPPSSELDDTSRRALYAMLRKWPDDFNSTHT